MGTRRLYYDDAYIKHFEARALGCVPAEPRETPGGTVAAWEVVLDQTALYPTSGGQPNDLGRLGEANVLDVRDDGEDIAHIVDREVELGPVEGRVNWKRRFDHMQQHTGQHLLSAMFEERFGLATVSFHLGEEICTIDVRGPQPNDEICQGAQRAANEVIFEDRPVNVRYGMADELARLGARKEVEREGLLRAIEIESADLQPCGGTHVGSTGQIGMILVRRCTKIRNDWRVEFVCGGRAERVASEDYGLLRRIGERLSSAPEEAVGSIDKAFAERDANFKHLRTALGELAEARASLLVQSDVAAHGEMKRRVIAETLTGAHPDLLLMMATELAKHEGVVALVGSTDTGQLVLAQNPLAGADLNALAKQVLTTFAGKGGGTKDFVRAKLADPQTATQAIVLAKTLLNG